MSKLSLSLLLAAALIIATATPLIGASSIANITFQQIDVPLMMVNSIVEQSSNEQAALAETTASNATSTIMTAAPSPFPARRGGLTGLITQVIKRLLAACIRIFRQALHRVQNWVLHTTDYLEILDARRILPSAVSRILRTVIAWARGMMNTEYNCVGRMLCEMSDQASSQIPASLRQVLMIYLSTNQEDSLFYKPLANGFISANNCQLLYNRCNQQEFLRKIDRFAASPEFGTNEIEEALNENLAPAPISAPAEDSAPKA